ncbi:unnamed protein product [Schistocephalus solidus]|uniref:PUM-HD domain-containing protein n=1 Tax=Schistocephalus solidus TaxID=70667 RepID=A0A183SAN7_SCHSO|nr:unnamed protein product [Schistocephalus solidus]
MLLRRLVVPDVRHHAIMKLTNHVGESIGTGEFLHALPQSFASYRAKALVRSMKLTHSEQLQMAVKAIEEDAGEDLTGEFEQRDSSRVVAELAVPILLVEMNDCGVHLL